MEKPSVIKSIFTQYLTYSNVLLVLAVIALATAFGGHMVRESLQYQRDAILSGQVWRALSAPLVHLNWPHTLMNLAGLIIIWGLFAQTLNNRAWLLISIGCTLAISTSLLLFNPEIRWYVGMSGLLHSYFAAGAIAERHAHKRTSIIMLILIFSKLLWELGIGPLPGSTETAGGKVIIEAHLYGAVSGIFFGWFLTRRNKVF